MNRQFESSFDRLRQEVAAGKRVFGVFGSPISHSLSPAMHNTAFAEKNINAVYLPFQVGKRNLEDALFRVRDAGISGLNITLPLKESVINYLDETVPAARKIGAVNTITAENGIIKGFNTDMYGFTAPLKEYVKPIKYEDVIIFGGGGAARTVLYALLNSYSFPHITLITRNEKQGGDLLDKAEYWKKFSTNLEWINFRNTKDCAERIWESRLIVNCTPLGMKGYGDEFPERLARFFRPGQVAYDLIYTPFMTSFLAGAEKRGALTLHGVDMFIHQGAKAFRIWTGKVMPVKIIKELILEKLGDR